MALTQDQWYQHPSFRAELVDLLKNPTLRIALEIVKERGLVSTLQPGPGVDMIDFFAIMGSRKDGYLEALINLEQLSKPKPTTPPEQKPWKTPPKPADSDSSSAP